ncbi:MAG: molybdopterin-dependent oxidoreductase [Bryobacteraceae bacterium]
MNYTRLMLAVMVLAGLVLAQNPPAAVLAVQGDVASPLSLTADDLAKMPRETATVPAPDGSKIVYEGVTLLAVLQKAGAPFGKQLRGKVLTTYVLAKAQDGYQVIFTLGELDPDFGNESILLADKRDGKPLADKQGPFRLVCPNDKEGARSVRMLQTLEVVRLAK